MEARNSLSVSFKIKLQTSISFLCSISERKVKINYSLVWFLEEYRNSTIRCGKKLESFKRL